MDQPSTFGGCGGYFVDGLSLLFFGIVIVIFLVTYGRQDFRNEIQCKEQKVQRITVKDTTTVNNSNVLRYDEEEI